MNNVTGVILNWKRPTNVARILSGWQASGRLNRVHRVAVNELPAPHSIHGRNWKGHVAHRTRLLRACEAWLKGARHEDRRDLLHV